MKTIKDELILSQKIARALSEIDLPTDCEIFVDVRDNEIKIRSYINPERPSEE